MPSVFPINLQEKAGAEWAVITGATDGIGKSYAMELAKMRFNVLLISRTQTKLDETKAMIEEATGGQVEVRTIAVDFSTGDEKNYEPLREVLSDLEIGVLVNNVGSSFEYPQIIHFSEGGPSRLAQITTTNTLPMVMLCAAVLPQMSERRAGIIINISSAAANLPNAYWNVYSASKRFVSHLSEILHNEYAQYGILVQTISPMLVATKMSKVHKPSWFAPSPKSFVRSAIRTIGLVQHTSGCLSHQIQVEAMSFLPVWAARSIMERKSHALRHAALKKRRRG